MKYSESHSKMRYKGNIAFYIVIACCLIAIGGASWFAVSSFKSRKPNTGSSQSSVQKNSSVAPSSQLPSAVTPSQDTAKPVKDVPYASSSSTSSVAESKPTPAAPAYTMPVKGAIIKNYSDKELQYSATFGDMRLHTGIDIACEDGTSVSACTAGTVLSCEKSSEYGNIISIDHGNGIVIKYASIKDAKVKKGSKVNAGDIIGVSTSIPCECADQSHIHIELYKNEKLTSPTELLKSLIQ